MFHLSFTLVTTDVYQECRKQKMQKCCKVETACLLHVSDVCLPRIFTELKLKEIRCEL